MMCLTTTNLLPVQRPIGGSENFLFASEVFADEKEYKD